METENMYKLESIVENFDKNISLYQEGMAFLYRSDGLPKYSDVEMESRKAQCIELLNASHENALKSLSRSFEALATLKVEVDGFSNTLSLDWAEMERATGLANFVREDCLTLPYEVLINQINKILVDHDTVAAYLYYRYCNQRIQESDRNIRVRRNVMTKVTKDTAPYTFRKAVEGLGDALGSKLGNKRKQYEKLLQAYNATQAKVKYLWREVNGENQVALDKQGEGLKREF